MKKNKEKEWLVEEIEHRKIRPDREILSQNRLSKYELDNLFSSEHV